MIIKSMRATNRARVAVSFLIAFVMIMSVAASGFALNARAPSATRAVTAAGAAAAATLPDMTGHWGESYVRELYADGVVSGMEDGLFHPDQEVTGAEYVKMIVESEFGAVAPTAGGDWASGYLERALELELISPSDAERAHDPVSRLDAARIGYNATIILWNELDENNISAASKLTDLNECADCVYTVAQMYVKGIIAGYPDGAFHGFDTLTRAESAVLIIRLLNPDRRIPQTISAPDADDGGQITPEQAAEMVATYGSDLILIDVRSTDEYAAGFVTGAVNIPLQDLVGNIDNLGMFEIPDAKDTVILLYCGKGSRSSQARKALFDAGYENAYYFGNLDEYPGDMSSIL